MTYESNVPSIRNATVDAPREISERRAATISRMVDEAAKRGLDDTFAYDAVAGYGRDNAKEFRKTLRNPESFREFADGFGTDHNRDIYEMEVVSRTGDELVIDFHYCPYVTAWVRQGKSEREIARLCEIAMAGDHAFADAFEDVGFELDGTIAQGRSRCRLRFTRKSASRHGAAAS